MIGRAELEKILERALAYPSGDNVQPFSFRWIDDKLFIFHDEAVARHIINPENLSSIFALGAFLTCLEVSAAADGYAVAFEKTPEFGFADKAWASIVFSKASSNLPMAQLTSHVLSARKTVRDHYSNEKVELSKLPARTEKNTSVKIRYVGALDDDFLGCLLDIEEANWKNANFVRDVFGKVVLSKKQYLTQRYGLYWRDLGVLLIDYPVVFLIKTFPALPKILWPLGFKIFLEMKFKVQMRKSAGFALMTVKNIDRDGFFAAGRECCHWWLQITKLGLVAQPLSAATMGIVYAGLYNDGRFHLTQNFLTKIQQQFQWFFKLDANETPIWMFRFGIPTKKYESTVRRSLTSVFRWNADNMNWN